MGDSLVGSFSVGPRCVATWDRLRDDLERWSALAWPDRVVRLGAAIPGCERDVRRRIPMLRDVEVAVLGPVEVKLDGRPVDLGTPKQRALVAALALSGGRPVSVDTIVDLLWGDAAPPGVSSHPAGLRLRPAPGARAGPGAPRPRRPCWSPWRPGYALRVADDAPRRARLRGGRARPAPRAADARCRSARPRSAATCSTEAVAGLDEALALWRGTPYAELEDAPPAVAERARLEELRLVALEDRARRRARARPPRHRRRRARGADRGAPAARAAVGAAGAGAGPRPGARPTRSTCCARCATVLADELGLEPGAELRDLQTARAAPGPGPGLGRPGAGAAGAAGRPSPPPAPTRDAPPVGQPAAAWPLVGRDRGARGPGRRRSTAAEAGAPAFAVLTGEPGIGKSRLCAELAARGPGPRRSGAGRPLLPGRRRAAAVAVAARCSSGLGAELAGGDRRRPTTAGAQFRTWERIVRTVRDGRPRTGRCWCSSTTCTGPTPPSLRVLRLLAETATDGPAAGRRHLARAPRADRRAGRRGRGAGPAARRAPRAGRAARRRGRRGRSRRWPHDRPSDGAGRRAAAAHRRQPVLPRGVRPAGRRARRPRPAARRGAPAHRGARRARPAPGAAARARPSRRCGSAAVVGREFDLATLAAVAGVDQDDLLDVLEPAQAAGLVREDGIDRFLFAHALVRDTLRRLDAAVPPGPAARPGRRGARRPPPAARPRWPGTGSPPARRTPRGPGGPRSAAAEVARRLTRTRRPPTCSGRRSTPRWPTTPRPRPGERYDVLMRLVDAYRWSATVAGADRHRRAGRRRGRGDRRPGAGRRARRSRPPRARCGSRRPHGEVHEGVVARAAPQPRPAAARGRRRCAAGCCSAWPTSSTTARPFEERRALVDEGLAMARRLGDPDAAAGRLPDRLRRRSGRPAPRRSGSRSATRRSSSPARTGDERATVVAGDAARGGPRRAGPAAGDVGGRRRRPRGGRAAADRSTGCWCSTAWCCPGWRWPAGSTSAEELIAQHRGGSTPRSSLEQPRTPSPAR